MTEAFKWESGFNEDGQVQVDSKTEVIKADQYRWPKNIEGRGSNIQEASAAGASSMFFGAWNRPAPVIYVDEQNKKILFSPHPNFPQGTVLDEHLMQQAADMGFQVALVNTGERGWKNQIKWRH